MEALAELHAMPVCQPGVSPHNQWHSSEEQQQVLLNYRLAYLAETEVNWCPGLGTVLANDEIVNGVSERGGSSGFLPS